MEYNKEKATMAKKDAESKIEENDFVGAKESALEAESLYPGLDGISSAPPPPSSPAPAQNVPPAPPRQIGGQSMPTHPGGSSAPPSPAPAQSVPPAPPRQTGESSTLSPTHPGGSSMASEKKSTKSRNGKEKVPVTPNSPTTFFTICHVCRYRFEYPRKYLRCYLMCIRCSKPFRAVEC